MSVFFHPEAASEHVVVPPPATAGTAQVITIKAVRRQVNWFAVGFFGLGVAILAFGGWWVIHSESHPKMMTTTEQPPEVQAFDWGKFPVAVPASRAPAVSAPPKLKKAPPKEEPLESPNVEPPPTLKLKEEMHLPEKKAAPSEPSPKAKAALPWYLDPKDKDAVSVGDARVLGGWKNLSYRQREWIVKNIRFWAQFYLDALEDLHRLAIFRNASYQVKGRIVWHKERLGKAIKLLDENGIDIDALKFEQSCREASSFLRSRSFGNFFADFYARNFSPQQP